MKKLLLVAILLGSFASFAQVVGPADPPSYISCREYKLYKCDANGKQITNSRNPNYVEYLVKICQETPSGGHIYYTLLQQVVDRLCRDGYIMLHPNVTILKVTKSPFAYGGVYVPIIENPVFDF
ncbi:hypothetical protein [Flavobacterium sp. NKUCC04_CG]|uniref:hypothetical protein n=1 Tax=Flavobacterium sp. NKUCC04_CG TaxID=2842121 RepID=UPI001C5A7167|nr:hypothetical protein [Flavobacterium sp. NKUCC04_CG]MBW3518674.1 hypothetical protein [Flavobacterium sp. NKUCC04_CG]